MNGKTGMLSIVATPIGNLGDIGQRALETLQGADLILVEDTRHAAILLSHYAISTPTRSYHEHNEDKQIPGILALLADGKNIALISDAGTPLISDPGYRLVKEAVAHRITVTPIPGPCAITAALSASGLPTDRFCFEGFLPTKASARERKLSELKHERRTLVFYETGQRIMDFIESAKHCLQADRRICIGREISKKFETFYYGNLDAVFTEMNQSTQHRKGEFVVVLSASTEVNPDDERASKLLALLVKELPLKKSCEIVSNIFSCNRNRLYKTGLEISGNTD